MMHDWPYLALWFAIMLVTVTSNFWIARRETKRHIAKMRDGFSTMTLPELMRTHIALEEALKLKAAEEYIKQETRKR